MQVNATVLFEIHAVVRKHHNLSFLAAIVLNLAKDLIERFERDAEPVGPLGVKQSVSCFEECEIVAGLRRNAEPFAKALHVRAPNLFGCDVDQKLERQWFLIVEIVHVRRWDLVGRATTEILPDATAKFSCAPIKIQTLITRRRRST